MKRTRLGRTFFFLFRGMRGSSFIFCDRFPIVSWRSVCSLLADGLDVPVCPGDVGGDGWPISFYMGIFQPSGSAFPPQGPTFRHCGFGGPPFGGCWRLEIGGAVAALGDRDDFIRFSDRGFPSLQTSSASAMHSVSQVKGRRALIVGAGGAGEQVSVACRVCRTPRMAWWDSLTTIPAREGASSMGFPSWGRGRTFPK